MTNFEIPHRRFNPLSGEWVLVSPQRARRPWLGQVERVPEERLPAYDPDCYLCPGSQRANGIRNPAYAGTFVFDNDFPALLPNGSAKIAQEDSQTDRGLFSAENITGVCKVICFSPRHDLSLPELPLDAVIEIVRTWTDLTRELGGLGEYAYVQVFENKGEMMGCSNPHPHSQLWATSILPDIPARELENSRQYLNRTGRCLLCDILEEETRAGIRIFSENADFIALVPFWAVWPFEVLLISRRHLGSLVDLTERETRNLAAVLIDITTRYDNLFGISFPYSMGFHQSPFDGKVHTEAHLHVHFYPPLLRSATVRKFMVGFEMLAMPQRDLTPESAAERLRSVPAGHYRQRMLRE